MERLQQALRADKMKPCVQDMTVLNLVEITRQKSPSELVGSALCAVPGLPGQRQGAVAGNGRA